MKVSELKKIAEFEIVSNLEVLKKLDTWMWVCIIMGLIFAWNRWYFLTLLVLIVLVLLNSKRNYDSGEVHAYYRKKLGIPSNKEYRRLKEKAKVNYQPTS